MPAPDPPPPAPPITVSPRIRVLLVEGATVVRRGLALALSDDPRVRLIAAPRTVAEAYQLIPERLADVVVVGTSFGIKAPVEVVAQLHRRFPGVGIILVSSRESDDELFGAIQAGAAAYLGLAVDLPTLHATLRRVAAGESVITDQLFGWPNVAAWLQAGSRPAASRVPHVHAGTAVLTEREREVLGRLAEGMTVEQIAAALDISRPTAKFHVRSIIRKLAHDADEEQDDPPQAGVPEHPQGPQPPPAGVPARLQRPRPSPSGHHAALPDDEETRSDPDG